MLQTRGKDGSQLESVDVWCFGRKDHSHLGSVDVWYFWWKGSLTLDGGGLVMVVIRGGGCDSQSGGVSECARGV